MSALGEGADLKKVAEMLYGIARWGDGIGRRRTALGAPSPQRSTYALARLDSLGGNDTVARQKKRDWASVSSPCNHGGQVTTAAQRRPD
jgi:hypothetical protein